MKNFAFHRPQSVSDALALLRADDAAKLLAGGQSLLPVMKLDLAQPSGLVSLAGIRDLKGVRSEGNDLVIGAFTTHVYTAAYGENLLRQQLFGAFADNELLGTAGWTVADDTGTTLEADWKTVAGLDLAEGIGQQVRIEWRFTGNGDGTYIGAYIDDVLITAP